MADNPREYFSQRIQDNSMSRPKDQSESPRVYWSPRPDQPPTSWLVQDLTTEMERESSQAVCIIEDINSYWLRSLEADLRLGFEFAEAHDSRKWSLAKPHAWHWAIEPNRPHSAQVLDEKRQWRCIDGFFSLPDSPRTRLSYYRVRHNVYLFLVDRPLRLPEEQSVSTSQIAQRGRGRTCLRFNYSTSRIGLFIPPLFDRESPFDLFDFLKEAMRRTWPRQCLFIDKVTQYNQPSAVRAHPLLYVLADFAWSHNLWYLDHKIKRISFQNIQSPEMDTVVTMHALREDLDFLRAEAGQTLRHAPPSLTNYYEQPTSGDRKLLGANETPLESLRRTADDANVLDGFLTNSLNLLIASIALRDSRRAEMLTWLAAIYVPLSFVTGIFGMNLRELNESTLPVWICLEVLGVVLLVTFAVVMMYKWWEKYRDAISRKSKRSQDVEDGP